MWSSLRAVMLWPLPALAGSLLAFGAAWALVNGVCSGVFAIWFSVLSGSAASEPRGRVLSFAYLPVNMASFLGPAVGGLLASTNVMATFPLAAVLMPGGVGVLALARRTTWEFIPIAYCRQPGRLPRPRGRCSQAGPG
jgi:MFS family permease